MTEQERLAKDNALRNLASRMVFTEAESIEYQIQRMAFKLNKPVEEIKDLAIIKLRMREMLNDDVSKNTDKANASEQAPEEAVTED